MRQQHSSSVLFLINLFVGSLAILVLCAGVGFAVNRLRSDSVTLATHSGNTLKIENYKRNELLYVRSKDIKAALLFKYLFVDIRPFSQYEKRHITGAIHYSMVDIRRISKPIVFYGGNAYLKGVKGIALKMLPGIYQPVFIMVDGLDGWTKNDLPTTTENRRF